jgi:transcriptional regulator with XRE-family HTH domain
VFFLTKYIKCDIISKIIKGGGKVATIGTTEAIHRKIRAAESVTKMLRETSEESETPTFGQYLDKLRQQKNLRKEKLFELSDVSTAYGYEILRDAKNPSRDTIIKFAFALGLNDEETQDLLKIAGKGKLYARMKRDKLIIYALSHSYSLADMNALADENDVPQIGKY